MIHALTHETKVVSFEKRHLPTLTEKMATAARITQNFGKVKTCDFLEFVAEMVEKDIRPHNWVNHWHWLNSPAYKAGAK